GAGGLRHPVHGGRHQLQQLPGRGPGGGPRGRPRGRGPQHRAHRPRGRAGDDGGAARRCRAAPSSATPCTTWPWCRSTRPPSTSRSRRHDWPGARGPGDCLNFHGLTSSFVPVFQRPIVTKVERIRLRDSKPPQYMTTNAEVIHFDKVASCVGGAFTNDEHEVVAHWFSFAYTEDGERKEIFRGMDSSIVKGVLDQIRESYSP
ncbi:unnamed protein product, partial [Heterosigma akashiwo]